MLFVSTSLCEAQSEHLITGQTMGTTYHIKVVGADVEDLSGLEEKIEQRLLELNQVFSTYIKDSEISRFHRKTSSDDWKLDGLNEETEEVDKDAIRETINENADPDVARDILYKLNKEIPQQDGYHHAEGNSDSHLKASLFGSSETIIIENGRLCLGTWQGVYFCEFDGPRQKRRVVCSVLGE